MSLQFTVELVLNADETEKITRKDQFPQICRFHAQLKTRMAHHVNFCKHAAEIPNHYNVASER